ncbi:MAG: FmdE family protein [Promethearchaeota archaeon]
MNENEMLEFARYFHDGVISAPYALGIKLTLAALDKLGIKNPRIKDLFVISETRHCFMDGIQVVSKATYGCGDLIIKNYGKLALTMLDKKTGNAVRVTVTPNFQKKMTDISNKIRELFKLNDRKKILEITENFGEEIMDMKMQDICIVKNVRITDNSLIENASIKHKEFLCENCGESILDYAVKVIAGKSLCPICAKTDKYYEIIE